MYKNKDEPNYMEELVHETRLLRQAVEKIGGRENASPAAPKTEQDLPTDDELRKFVTDDEIYKEIIVMANSCQQVRHIRSRVKPLLKEAGLHADLICSEPMVKMLLPHLKNFQGSKAVRNIKSALY